MDRDQCEQDPDRPEHPATHGADHLRRPPPLLLHQGGPSQLTGGLSSTTINDSLGRVHAHSAAMSPTRDFAATNHSVKDWALTRVQRLNRKVGSVVTSVGSASSTSRYVLTGGDADRSKPQSYPNPKTTSHKLLQSPFKASFGAIGRKKGHERATSDPNISLPQPIQLTGMKSPEEREREARMMDEFKFEWAKACRPGITMEDLRPNSQPSRPTDSEEMEAAYAEFQRKSDSAGVSGSPANRFHESGVGRASVRLVTEGNKLHSLHDYH